MSIDDLLPQDADPPVVVWAKNIQILGRTLQAAASTPGPSTVSAHDLLRQVAGGLRDAVKALEDMADEAEAAQGGRH